MPPSLALPGCGSGVGVVGPVFDVVGFVDGAGCELVDGTDGELVGPGAELIDGPAPPSGTLTLFIVVGLWLDLGSPK